MKKSLSLFLALLFLPLAAFAADAPPFPTRGKFVWSDLCVGPKPWELHGHRIVLIHDPEFDDVTIEFFDKGWDSDVLHSPRVLFDPQTGALIFSYEDYSDEYLFVGNVSSHTLAGAFDDDQRDHTLPRVPNSWPEEPPCPTPPDPSGAAPDQTAAQ